MFRTATLFSIGSWLPVIASSLLPGHPSQPEIYFTRVVGVLMMLALIWHFAEVRHWRTFTRPQSVTWCLWSGAMLSLIILIATSPFWWKNEYY